MEKNVLRKFTITFLLLITTSVFSKLNAQQYEVYDGDTFSVMFTVRNGIAENVKFASKGAKDWTDFEVIDSREGNKAVFTVFVVDGRYNGYQIDYYEGGYIWVFNLDNNGNQIGNGWKLVLRENVSSNNSTAYEVYDGDTFSVMFTVRNGIAENVKFAKRGAKDWADFEVIDSREGNNAVFTVFVVDGKYNGYQIDYYEGGYIWVFNMDNNGNQIGNGWRLNKRK